MNADLDDETSREPRSGRVAAINRSTNPHRLNVVRMQGTTCSGSPRTNPLSSTA